MRKSGRGVARSPAKFLGGRRYEGKGKFEFPNGVVYEGEFRKGEFHGEGALVYPNGGRRALWEGSAAGGRVLWHHSASVPPVHKHLSLESSKP